MSQQASLNGSSDLRRTVAKIVNGIVNGNCQCERETRPHAVRRECGMVPGAGLEPARLAAQASKTCVAANYTTPARTAVEALRLPFSVN